MNKKMIADGLGWPEGPTVLGDGRVCFVETFRSQVSVYGKEHGVRRYAYTAGGPNACVVGSAGELYVCQNGGTCGPWRADEMVVPSIQRIESEGARAEVVATEIDGVKLNGPNDLVFGPDGSLYFTDPGTYRPADPEPSHLFALHHDGTGKLLLELDPPTFPNGIAFDGNGRLVWTESYTGMVRRMDVGSGRVEDVGRLPGEHPVADGLAVSADGRLFVTSVNGGGIDVMSEEGEILNSITICPNPTNCVFTGEILYVTAANAVANTTEPSFTGSMWSVEAGVTGVLIRPGSIR